METIIIMPKDKKEVAFMKTLLEKIKIKYRINTSEKVKEITNPELIKRIERVRKNKDKFSTVINPDNIWHNM